MKYIKKFENQENSKILWWGYKHTSGTLQAKRYFGPLDIEEAEESPFCEIVVGPFEAIDREDALKKVRIYSGLKKKLDGYESFTEAIGKYSEPYELHKANREKLKLDIEDVRNIFQDLADVTNDVWEMKIQESRYVGEYYDIRFEQRKGQSPTWRKDFEVNDKRREDFIVDHKELFGEMRDRVDDYGVVLVGPNRRPGQEIDFSIKEKNNFDGSNYYG